MLVLMALHTYVTMANLFQPIELARKNQISVNPNLPIQDLLYRLRCSPSQFKEIMNFHLDEFLQLSGKVVPVIEGHARSTGVRHVLTGRPSKLSREQHLLNFLLYMKHDNIIYFDAMLWNWSRSSLCDDAIFVASYVNKAIGDEIRWPTLEERHALAAHIPQLPGCIGFVDGTLVRIHRPFENEHHARWFQSRKKMYCMNNTILVDHQRSVHICRCRLS